jgi:hypothetical protein
MRDYEKLGAFYLGRRTDTGQTLLYDSKDLVTHAVCVGMTGSGKTGLCIGLLEEAAIDGIPALVIDPKGDLANLLLTFPELKASDFEPWVNEDDARKKGLSKAEFAAQQAELWRNGLAKWDQDGARIARLREAADFAVYTPGSDAGIPLSVMSSFAAPPESTREDREAMRDHVASTVTGLLGLAGVDAGPIQSREHVLLANIMQHAWSNGESLDLAGLIARVQSPPMTKVGVMELDTFYPAKDRFALSMTLNNLLASPGFEAWMTGEPLDVDRLLYTASGKPRVAILSIAHLSDAERMFFVSLLLSQTLAWTRKQSGTASLRAIVYMDEIFGYFPPVANPPSKKPLLTMLKQARASGVGVVLATQNPVDLDYKGLANTGTWFIGRLQTERDKARVLEGLEGASAASGGGFDKQAMERTLAGLGNRVFLMNNVHDGEPVLFETRWCLSYLRGPLSRPQIRQLMNGRRAPAPAPPRPAAVASGGSRPVLPPEIPQYFLPFRGSGHPIYEPVILGAAEVHFTDPKLGVDEQRKILVAAPVTDAAVAVDWERSEDCGLDVDELEKSAEDGASFAALPAEAAKPRNYASWQKDLAAWLFRTQSVDLHRAPALKLTSRPGESEREFRIRLSHAQHERRDEFAERLRAKYAPRLAALEERKRKALQVVERERQQASAQKVQSVLDVGASLLGAFLGRRGSAATKVAGAARSMQRASKESSDVGRAEETAEAVDQQLRALQQQFEEELASAATESDVVIETVSVKPEKTNIAVKFVALGWRPR